MRRLQAQQAQKPPQSGGISQWLGDNFGMASPWSLLFGQETDAGANTTPKSGGRIPAQEQPQTVATNPRLMSPAPMGPAEFVPAQVPVDPATTAAPEPTNPFAPYEKLHDQLGYPDVPDTSGAYAQLDAAAAREAQRTHLLAKLAFASGLTAAGGGSWEKVAQGLSAAGEVHDKGHQRYLKALQNSADRMAQQQNMQYEHELARRNSIADLYKEGESNKIEQEKLARQALKDRQETIKTYFGDIFDLEPNGDAAMLDPEADARKQRLREAYKRSIHHGEIVDFDDVRD